MKNQSTTTLTKKDLKVIFAVIGAFLILVILMATVIAIGTARSKMTPEEITHFYKNNSFTIPVTPWHAGGSHTVYGELISLQRLSNSEHGVTAFRPLNRGGEFCEDYGWRTFFVPAEILEMIGGDTRISERGREYWIGIDDAFRIEVIINNDDGGFINLPCIIVGLEVIDREEIPSWGGK